MTNLTPDDFKLSHNETLADLLATNNIAKLNNLISIARRTVTTGGNFSLTDTSNGIELSVHVMYSTSAELEAWVLEINKLRAALDQLAIG